MEKRWLTPIELETDYGIAQSTQAKMRMLGKIPYAKVSKFIRYDRLQIDKWLENHQVVSVA